MLTGVDLLGLELKDPEWYQMMVRAVIVFVVALIFIRLAGMRSFGFRSPFDVVLSITIGAVLSRGITGQHPFFSCLGAAITLAFFHRLVAWLSYKSRMIHKLTEGDPVLLYNSGELYKHNLAKYNITEGSIIRALHKNNQPDYKKVQSVWLETDGTISVVLKEE